MIPHQNPPPDADLTSADELGQRVASSFSQAPCLFEQDCLYYPDIARGLPMFRIVDSTDSSPAAQCSVSVRDSFGEGVYIENNRSDRLCSTDCHCRRLGALDFAFIVSKHSTHTKIEVRNEVLQNTLIDVISSDERSSQCDSPAWDGAHLFARYEDLEARLRDVIDAPVGSIKAQPFLPLKLLVDGFLGQGLDRSPRHKDASYILADVFPDEDRNSMLDVKLLQAAGDGNTSVIAELLSNRTMVPSWYMRTLGGVWGRKSTDDPSKETANIDAYDEYGNTALLRAAAAGHLDVARLLVTRGAKIDWANNQGETALHKAAQANHSELFRFLKGVGADRYAKDNSGATPALKPVKRRASVRDWSGTWTWPSLPRQRANSEERPSEPTVDGHLAGIKYRLGVIDSHLVGIDDHLGGIDDHLGGIDDHLGGIDDYFLGEPPNRPSPSLVPLKGKYRDLLFKTDLAMNTDKVKETMRGLFIREHVKVRKHLIFNRVRGRFHNAARAWQSGMTALHKISNGYLPHELGMAMALLCVCKAVLGTLHIHKHDSSKFLFDDAQFRQDLPRWLPLFQGADRNMFKAAAQDIWSVDTSTWTLYTPQTLDYHDLFKHAERLTSDLDDAVRGLYGLVEFAELWTSGHGQQRPSHQDRSLLKDPDPGDLGIGASSQKSLLWAEVMAGVVFSILLIFLLWLHSILTGAVQFIATELVSWHISVDVQSVPRSMQSHFASTVTVGRPSSPQPSTARQDVVVCRQDSDDDHQVQPWGSPASSPSSGGVPGSVGESSRRSRPFACPEKHCGERFTRKDNRDRHLKNNHGPESEKKRPCKTCGKKYTAQYLRVHKCNPNKPFRRRSRARH